MERAPAISRGLNQSSLELPRGQKLAPIEPTKPLEARNIQKIAQDHF